MQRTGRHGGKWAVGAWVVLIVVGRCAVGRAAPALPGNLVANPSFEQGSPFTPTGWEPRFGARWAAVGHTGRRCLRITRPRPEHPQQDWTSGPMRIQPGRRWLTLSAWFKTSDVGMMWAQVDPTYNANLTTVFLDAGGADLGKKTQVSQHRDCLAGWAYKESTFQVPPRTAAMRIQFRFGRPRVVGTAWVDDVALTYADPPDTAPTGTHGMQLTTRRPGMIFYPEDDLEFPLRLSGDPLPAGTRLRYEVRDHTTLRVAQGTVPIDPKHPVLRLPGHRPFRQGVYHELHAVLEAHDKPLAEDLLPFGIMAKRPYDPRTKPDPFQLCGHGHSIPWLENVWIPLMLDRLGVRQCFLIGSDPADKVLAWIPGARKKYGIEFATNGPIRCTNWGKKDVKRSFFSDEQAFRACLAKIMGRYKGAISQVGIMGELGAPTPLPAAVRKAAGATSADKKRRKDQPFQWRHFPEERAREQAEVMRIFRDEARKIDPSLRVAAGGYFNPEMDLLIDAGMFKHTDVLMVHKFAVPKEADRQFRVTIDCFKKRGLPVPPLWVDEAHCNQTSHEHTATEIVKMHTIFVHYGVEMASWIRFIWRAGTPDAMLWRCLERKWDMLPRMPFFTYAVMTRHLHAVQPVRKIDLASGQAVGYLFRHGDESVLAAWRWEPGPAVPLRLVLPPTTRDVSVFDVWDDKRVLRAHHRQVVVGLSASPVFVRFAGKPVSVGMAATWATSPAAVSINTTTPVDVPVEVANVLGVPVEATVRLALPAQWQAEPAQRPVRLAPGATATVRFRVRAGGDYRTDRPYAGWAEVASGGSVWARVPVAMRLVEPIRLTLGMTRRGRAAAVKVRLHNSGPDAAGALEIVTHLTDALRPTTIARGGLRLKPGQTTDVVVPLACPVGQPDMYPIEATFTTAAGRVSRTREVLSALFSTHAARPHAVDARLDDGDWQGVEPVVLASDVYAKFHEPVHTLKFFYRFWCNEGMWKGPEHWHVHLWTQWDEANLYLRVKVRQVNHLNDFRGQSIWAGDALQICIDADPLKPGKQRHRFNAALTSADGVVVLHRAAPFGRAQPDGLANVAGVVKTAIKWYPESHYTVYELAFPRDRIVPVRLEPGGMVGLTVVAVNRHYPTSLDPPALRFGTGMYVRSCDPADVRINLVP